jgi:hypothetical protein
MSFDCSRFPFRPEHNFSGVVMQQGRVQLDSDWNEWLAEISRRIQAGTLDTFGGAVVPSTTPNAFFVTLTSATTATIGPGRMYVDGLLVENHGLPAQRVQWDSALAEMSAAPAPQTPPLPAPNPAPAAMQFTQQPYYPGVTFPPGGPFLAYIDVWQRPVTYLQHPHLIEKAVGIDTTGRLQTVWQVDLLDLSKMSNASSVTCSTDIPAFDSLIRASGAELTTSVSTVGTPGPCCLTTSTGYTGMENQLYRLEIHQTGGAAAGSPGSYPGGQATFKWSRDNASVATAVTNIVASTSSAGQGSLLSVESTGKDDVLSFKPGDWIEITDDYLELRGQCGQLHKIDVNGVDPVGKTILLVDQVDPTITQRLPANSPPPNYPDCHARICRWDQKGKVYQSDGSTVWVDLDAAGRGDIPVPPPNTSLILENGVTVTFGMNAALSDQFKSCDFWAFAARASDGSVETLANAPPMGVHHHYAKLGVLSSPTKWSDCRTPWPPKASTATTESCACTVCVEVADFNKNPAAIASAIASVDTAGGGRVCLGPGVFVIGATSLTLKGLKNPIILSGQGRGATTLLFYGDGAAIDVQMCYAGLRIEDLGIVAVALSPPAGGTPATTATTPVAIGIRLQNTAQSTVARCGVLALSADEFKAAAAAAARATEARAEKAAAEKPAAGTAKAKTAKAATAEKVAPTEEMAVKDALVNTDRKPIMVDISWVSQVDSVTALLSSYTLSPGAMAIALDGLAVEVQLRDNFLVADAGIGKTSLLATTAGGASADVAGLTAANDWMIAADVTIADNLLVCAMAGIAIVDLTGNSALTYFGAQTAIADNRIFDCAGTGILVAGIAYATSDAAIRISGNHVEVPGSGIVCATDMAVIEDNYVTQAMTTVPSTGAAPPLGIMVAAAATAAPPITGTRIAGNSVHFLNGPGVVVAGSVVVSSIVDNSISGVVTAGINIVGNASCVETIIRDNEIMVVTAPVPGTPAAASQTSFLNSLSGLGAAPAAASAQLQAFGVWVSAVPIATVQNNTIAELGAAGTTTTATGIMLQGVLRAIASGNDITEIAQSTQTITGIDIAIGAGFMDAGISGNAIAQTAAPSPPSIPATTPSFTGIKVTATSDAKTAATLSVDNNGVTATSVSALIDINVTTAPVHCVVTGNRCNLTGLRTAAVSIAGPTVIASNNRVVYNTTDIYDALVISNGTTTVPATNVTVLGNIVDGHLKLNGTALAPATAPWGPLNIFKP